MILSVQLRPLLRCILIALLAIACPIHLIAAPRQKVPGSWEIQSEIRKDLDDLASHYKRYFRNRANLQLLGVVTSNSTKREIIAPLYRKAFNINIPAGPAGEADKEELANVVDPNLYGDTWQKAILNTTAASSDYLTNRIAAVLADPRTDRAAVMRIQKDASDEWDSYKNYAAGDFSRAAAQINSDYQDRLASLAREHRDLREALAAVVGPIPIDDFDLNFQKYVDAANARLKSTITPSAPAAATASSSPAASSPIPAATPAAENASQKPAKVPQVAGLIDPLKTSLNDLATKLNEQKQTLDAVKLQAQTLDDNYPMLHREMAGEIEKVYSGLFWLRFVLVVVGVAALLGIGIGITALNRTAASGKSGGSGKRKQDSENLREEPLKLILQRIYNLEQDLSRLQERLVQLEIAATAESHAPEAAEQEAEPDSSERTETL